MSKFVAVVNLASGLCVFLGTLAFAGVLLLDFWQERSFVTMTRAVLILSAEIGTILLMLCGACFLIVNGSCRLLKRSQNPAGAVRL